VATLPAEILLGQNLPSPNLVMVSSTILTVFFVTGAIGSVASWIVLRRNLQKEDPEFGALTANFAWSRGASASCYGMAGFVSMLAPGLRNNEVEAALSLSPADYRLAICLLVSLSLFADKTCYLRAHPVRSIPVFGLFCYVFRQFGQLHTISGGVVLYNVNTALQRGYPRLYHVKTRASTTDYMSHFSGYIVGSFFALAYLFLVANVQPFSNEYAFSVGGPFLTLVCSEVAAPELHSAFEKYLAVDHKKQDDKKKPE